MISQQKHRSTCGIVAVKNALEFKGRRVQYEKLLRYSIRNLGFKHNGMIIAEVRKLMKRYKIKYKNIKHPSFKDISNQLNLGRGLIFLYRYSTGDGDSAGHYIFIDKETKRFFRAWNKSGSSNNMLMKKELAKDLRYSHRHWRHRYAVAMSII